MGKKAKSKVTKKKRENSGCVPAENQPGWLEWIAPERFDDSELFRIITFFIFHSPCAGKINKKRNPISAMYKPVSDYGWSERWGDYRSPDSLNFILRNASSNPNIIFPANSNQDMLQACQNADLLEAFPKFIERERVAFCDSERNQFLSLFRHIRNAFSHARFNMYEMDDGDLVFVLEDISTDSKDVSARMILRKSTLLKWIDIIRAGPNPRKK